MPSWLLYWVIISAYFSENGRILLPVKHKEHFSNSNIENFPTSLFVEDNKIVELSGEVIK